MQKRPSKSEGTLWYDDVGSYRVAILTDWPEIDASTRNPTLNSVIHQQVGEPIDSTCSAAEMYAAENFSPQWQLWAVRSLRAMSVSPFHLGLLFMLFFFGCFFFELMPCTLETLTVMKTFCLWLAIPTYWRIGESKSQVSSKTKQTNPTKNKTKTRQEDT